MNADTGAVAGVAGLNPAISEHVIMPCLTMLLHTAAASPSTPAPAASGAGGDLTAGRTSGTTTAAAGGGPTASITGGTTAAASRQRATASHSEAFQSAGRVVGSMT